MEPIGGYFGLELREGVEYHKDAIRLNSGRNAFEYILLTNKYKKVYLPYYSCDALLEPVIKLGLEYSFYHVDQFFKPMFDFQRVEKDACFLYINYYGIKTHFITYLAEYCQNLIIDNSQAFFALPERDIPTFYSCRKFFGVPDGAYLYTDILIKQPLSVTTSYNNCFHLLQKLDNDTEIGFMHYKENEKAFSNSSIKGMSALTQKMLKSINYKCVAEKRKVNFNHLHTKLKQTNILELTYVDQCVPLSYPYCCDNSGVWEYMIKKKIYTPRYWAEVLNRVDIQDIEYDLVNNIFHIPVDQRYGVLDMDYIVDELLNFLQ